LSRADGVPAISPIAYAAIDPQTASEHGAQVIAGKPSCLGQSPDGSCISFQLPRVRMVRVPTPRAASVGHQGNSAKPGIAANSFVKKIVESKKSQRSAHRLSQRRNQALARGSVSSGSGAYARQGFTRNFW